MANAIVQISAEVFQHLQSLVDSHLCQKVLGLGAAAGYLSEQSKKES